MAGSVPYTSIVQTVPNKTTVILSDGSQKTFTGDRGWRNNNPGNVGGEHNIRTYGALGTDYGGNLVFPTMQAGYNAQKRVVFNTSEYQDRTIRGMLSGDLDGDGNYDTSYAYAPVVNDDGTPISNDPNSTNWTYPDRMEEYGWDLDRKISDIPEAEQDAFLADMIRVENGTENANNILEEINNGDTSFDTDGEGEDTVSDKSGDGTTGRSSSQKRNDSYAPSTPSGSSGSSGQSQSGGEYGFKDPDNTFSATEYQAEQQTNFAARGDWQQKTKLGSMGTRGSELLRTEATPEYPHNKVIESTNPNPKERHRIELDDTKGGERLTIAHKKGTAVEMWEDGELTVCSYGDTVQVVGGDFTMVVNRNGKVTYVGNLDLTVEGDMNLNVTGNMNTTVGGNYTETIKKDKIERVGQDNEKTIVGSIYETVGGTKTDLVLGANTRNYFTKGKQRFWFDDDVEFISKGNMHFSSETKVSTSSPIVNTTASVGNWQVDAGTLGGPGVHHYGASWAGDINIDGDLNISGEMSAGGDITAFGTISMPDNTTYAAPTTDTITNTLTATEEGVMQISIDPGNKIKQSIDLRERLSIGSNKGPQG